MARSPQFSRLIRLLQQARRTNLADAGESAPLTSATAKKLGLLPWKRRRFLKATVLAAGGAIAATTLSHWDEARSQTEVKKAAKIAIIGGGIAGLQAAYQLKKAGLTATVYEARNRLGGRMLTVKDVVGEGLITDLGGSFINSEHEDMLALVEEFGLNLVDLASKERKVPKTAYYFDGKLRSEAELAEKFRPLAAQITEDADALDKDYDRLAPEFDKLSVKAYLDKHSDKISDPIVRTLVRNSILTEYGVDLRKSSALQLLLALPTVEGVKVEIASGSDERYMVAEGNGSIIDNLAANLSQQIKLGFRLTRIAKKGEVYSLDFANKETIEADWVILALPFTVLRDVKLEIDLPNGLSRCIKEVSLGWNEKLIAGFKSKIWEEEKVFSGEIWTDLEFAEAWVESERQPNLDSGAIVFFFSGDRVRFLQADSATAVGEKVIDRFDRIVEGAKAAANNKFSRTEWRKDPFTKGSYTNFKPGQLTEFAEYRYIEAENPEESQEVRLGKLIFAGEQVSDEFYGYMNGGAQTGRLAAEIIIRESRST